MEFEFIAVGLLIVGVLTLALSIIGGVLYLLFSAVKYLVTHRKCPTCKEKRPWNITRVRSGDYPYHTLTGVGLRTENPLAVSFDAEGNMYTRKYNRICNKCGEKFYINECRWPRGTKTGPTLQMRKDEGRSKKNLNHS